MTRTCTFSEIDDSCGPFAKSVDDLVESTKILFNSQNNWYDPTALPIPFNEDKF